MSAAVLTLSFSQRNVRDAFRPCPLFSSSCGSRAGAGWRGAVPWDRRGLSSGGSGRAAGPRLRPGGNLGKEGCRGRFMSTPRETGPGQSRGSNETRAIFVAEELVSWMQHMV